MPSYSCCAIIIVFLTGKRAACCSLLVMNGGTAPFLRSFVVTELTIQVAVAQIGEHGVRFFLVPDLDVCAVALQQLRVELGRHRPRQMRRDLPVFLGDERVDLTFAVDDQFQRDRLHASGGQAAADLVPQSGLIL